MNIAIYIFLKPPLVCCAQPKISSLWALFHHLVMATLPDAVCEELLQAPSVSM